MRPRRCRFLCARVEDALGRVAARARRRAGVRDAPRLPALDARGSAVVLDPPRSGCSAEVVRQVGGHLQPDVIVYVSCEPSALARDVAGLVAAARASGGGYRIDRVQPLDMFPHTPHIETVAVLQRASSELATTRLPAPPGRRRAPRMRRGGRAA